MTEQLTDSHKAMVTEAIELIKKASILVGKVDEELQYEGSTGPNMINHTEHDLANTASYMKHWIVDGIEL